MIIKQQCLLCGKPTLTGLSIMDCLICFDCEKQLMLCTQPPTPDKRLMRLYDA